MNLDEVETLMSLVKRVRNSRKGQTRRRIVPGDGDHRHGTTNGYGNLGCRCELCCAANTKNHAEWVQRSGYRPLNPETGERRLTMKEYNKVRPRAQHGSETMYKRGCRCDKCRFAAMAGRASRGRS